MEIDEIKEGRLTKFEVKFEDKPSTTSEILEYFVWNGLYQALNEYTYVTLDRKIRRRCVRVQV